MGSKKSGELQKVARAKVLMALMLTHYFRTVRDSSSDSSSKRLYFHKGQFARIDGLKFLVRTLVKEITGISEGGSTQTLNKFMDQVIRYLIDVHEIEWADRSNVSFEGCDEDRDIVDTFYDAGTRDSAFVLTVDDRVCPYLTVDGKSGYEFLRRNWELFHYGPQSFGYNSVLNDMVVRDVISPSFYRAMDRDAFAIERAYSDLISLSYLIRAAKVYKVDGKVRIEAHVSLSTLTSPILSEVVPKTENHNMILFGDPGFIGPYRGCTTILEGFVYLYDLPGHQILHVWNIDGASLSMLVGDLPGMFTNGKSYMIAVSGQDRGLTDRIIHSFSDEMVFEVKDRAEYDCVQLYGISHILGMRGVERTLGLLRAGVSRPDDANLCALYDMALEGIENVLRDLEPRNGVPNLRDQLMHGQDSGPVQ